MAAHLRRNAQKEKVPETFWAFFQRFLESTRDSDSAVRNLAPQSLGSAAYRRLDARISALSDALHGNLAAMTELANGTTDERAALLACTAQFIEAKGFNGSPEVAHAIHVLARSAAKEVSDPELREPIIWLLDRVDPAQALCAEADMDDDAPGTWPKRSGP